PFGFSLSLNSQIISRTPVVPLTTNVDLSGTGATSSGPLPGLSYSCAGITCGQSAIAQAVASFNATYAGQKAPNGNTIPTYVLPPQYQLGRPTIAQDLRLTKTFVYRERFRVLLMAEVFNALNIANLTGYSFNLDAQAKAGATQTFAFGQPTQRASQIFLSGGPRAEQLAFRFVF
ncbi:MAG: hypothetical protein WA213_19220, partial [Terriglobales bacterium]